MTSNRIFGVFTQVLQPARFLAYLATCFDPRPPSLVAEDQALPTTVCLDHHRPSDRAFGLVHQGEDGVEDRLAVAVVPEEGVSLPDSPAFGSTQPRRRKPLAVRLRGVRGHGGVLPLVHCYGAPV
ncbi:MAG: hypothetical protein RLZZ347_811 [Candidatus Parcubacteria bacterium]